MSVTSSRPKRSRRNTSKVTKQPSSALYVGYVDENESLEQIMKRFEVLEHMQQNIVEMEHAKMRLEDPKGKGKATGEEPDTNKALSEAQLENFFNQTSHWTPQYIANPNCYESDTDIDSSRINNSILDFLAEDVPIGDDGGTRWISESESSDPGWGDEAEKERRVRRKERARLKRERVKREREERRKQRAYERANRPKKERKPRVPRERKKREPRARKAPSKKRARPAAKAHNQAVATNGFVYTMRRAKKWIDPNLPVYIRIPAGELKQSWAKTVEPYSPYLWVDPLDAPERQIEKVAGARTFMTDCIDTFDILGNITERDYQCILMDPPWQLPFEERDERCITPAQLKQHKWHHLVGDMGFVFIWCPKIHITDLFDLMRHWGYYYVENVAWVLQNPNNSPMRKASDIFARSKETLYIFRKVEGPKIELRHQRTPDVLCHFVKPTHGLLKEPKPLPIYDLIETLLPDARLSSETGRGRLVELWAPADEPRPGWTQVVETTTAIVAERRDVPRPYTEPIVSETKIIVGDMDESDDVAVEVIVVDGETKAEQAEPAGETGNDTEVGTHEKMEEGDEE